MNFTDRNSTTRPARTNARDVIVRRWYATSQGVRRALAGLRGPRRRRDTQALIDAYGSGRAPESIRLPGKRAEALGALCETLLRQLDDEQAMAAEIRVVVHKRGELPPELVYGPRPEDALPLEGEHEDEDDELLWELRRLLASSGGTIADVAHALERRGEEVDRKGRELLEDEVRAVEVDIAILKSLLSDPVDWDRECGRLVAGEIPPFEDGVADGEHDDED
jgi:hypothetical protein